MGAIFTKADQAGYSEEAGFGGEWKEGRKWSGQRTARSSV